MMPRARLNFQTFQIQILIQNVQVQLYFLYCDRYLLSGYSLNIYNAGIMMLYTVASLQSKKLPTDRSGIRW